jgi:tetratricopeptide (TPR) repeat protein
VLVAQEDWLAFRHELGRRAVLESMSPAHRLALHRMALDTLRGSPATRTDLTRLAHHAAGAADGEAVLAFAPTAARQAAAAGAHRAATELFALAVRYADDLPLAEHARLRDEYSVELDTIDKKRLAVDERRTAADLWQRAGDRPHHGESLSRVAQLLQILGDPDEALALNRMALEVLETLPPDHSLITALNTQAWLCLADRGSSTEGVALAERAIAIADALGYDVELPRLYEILGLSWLYLDPAIGVGHLERGLRLAIDHELVTRASNIYSNLASILVDFHRFLDADAMFAEAFAFVTERDLDAIRQYLEGWQAVLHVHRGRWHEATAIAGRLADDPGAEAGRGMALLALGRLRARRGEPGAISALDEALVLIRRQGYRQREGLVLAARAEAHALAGNDLGASVDARDGRALAEEFHHPWYLGEHAYWQRWAGDRPDLDDWAAAPTRSRSVVTGAPRQTPGR